MYELIIDDETRVSSDNREHLVDVAHAYLTKYVDADHSALRDVLARNDNPYLCGATSAYIEEKVTEVTMSADYPVLYILMRNDCLDLNPGKAVAQGTHAANQMVAEAGEGHLSVLSRWESETTQGFGTCIVLSVSYPELEQTVALARLLGLHAGITHDPSYPMRDGHKYFTAPVNTCGYVFGMKSDCEVVTKKFPLMK